MAVTPEWQNVSSIPADDNLAMVRWSDGVEDIQDLHHDADPLWWEERGATHWRYLSPFEALNYANRCMGAIYTPEAMAEMQEELEELRAYHTELDYFLPAEGVVQYSERVRSEMETFNPEEDSFAKFCKEHREWLASLTPEELAEWQAGIDEMFPNGEAL